MSYQGEGTIDEKVVQEKSKDYDHGTVVELTAIPAKGYKFVGWKGDISTSENPAEIVVNELKEVTAVFEKRNFRLRMYLTDGGSVADGGSVSKDPEPLWTHTFGGDIEYPKIEYIYQYQTEVELTANQATDWEFDHWEGDVTGTNPSIMISMDTTKTVTAIFRVTAFSGGEGTKDDPHQVSTVQQLQKIDKFPDGHYIQINEIDASATSQWNEGKGFTPISGFTGSYNGNNYKIRNLIINRSDKYGVGLFEDIEESVIKNVALKGINIQGKVSVGGLVGTAKKSEIINTSTTGKISGSATVGGLIGSASNSIIRKSYSEVNVSGSRYGIGGLVGYSSSKIYTSYYSGSVTGDGTSGGLVGTNSDTIIKSFSSGEVSGSSGIGGLVGKNDGYIYRSYSESNVLGTDNVAGGLVGGNGGEIAHSFAKGKVTGSSRIGGLVGRNSSGNIKGSYSKSDITGSEYVGGLVGHNYGEADISESYATGNISGNNLKGGLVGFNGNLSSVTKSYWDVDKTNQSNGVGDSHNNKINHNKGLTTPEMTGTAAKDNMVDFDWSEIWVTTDSYPAFFWE